MYLNELDNQLFRGKYRIPSARLPCWDYSSDGYYFVTICVKDRECVFGNIKNGIMGLNELGCIVAKCWQEIPKHFENVILDQWVVMPNHLHGVVQIYNAPVETLQCDVSTGDNRPRKYPKNHPIHQQFSKISPKSKSLSAIIGSFKSIVARTIRKKRPDFQWQSRFYDHIIRNDKSLNRIRQYILNNPWKWEQDRNNPENLWM